MAERERGVGRLFFGHSEDARDARENRGNRRSRVEARAREGAGVDFIENGAEACHERWLEIDEALFGIRFVGHRLAEVDEQVIGAGCAADAQIGAGAVGEEEEEVVGGRQVGRILFFGGCRKGETLNDVGDDGFRARGVEAGFFIRCGGGRAHAERHDGLCGDGAQLGGAAFPVFVPGHIVVPEHARKDDENDANSDAGRELNLHGIRKQWG